MDYETVHTSDVLIIGGGGAALIAACAAADAGMSVNLVSKKPFGLASCTAYAGGGFTAPLKGVSVDQHRQMTLTTGCGLNDPDLIDVLSSEAPEALERLRDWGVDLKIRPGGAFVRGKFSNPMTSGTGMTLPLVDRCKALGVGLHHRVRVERLLQEDFGGQVYGAEGRDRDGTPTQFRAGATILATGGGGWLYSRTDNPSGTTGDGYLLALGAGARLRDMEFVQFYPLGSAPGSPTTWYMGVQILDHARLVDGTGEAFVPSLFEQWGISSGAEANRLERDRLSRAIALLRRHTGRVTLHLEDIPEDMRKDQALAHRAQLLGGRRKDTWCPVEVAPIQHFMSGGAVVDPWGRTEIPGLYACGEVTGGVHGANRIGGNALTELTVFGIRAAETAAREAQGAPPPRGGQAFIRPGRPIVKQAESGEGAPLSFQEVRHLADEFLGPLRDHDGLEKALARLGQWAHDGEDPGFEHRAIVTTATLVALAALTRKESRGCHYRSDFAEESDERNVVLLQAEPSTDGPDFDLQVSATVESL